MTRKPFRLAVAAVSALAISSVCAAPMAFADDTDQTKVGGVSQSADNPALVNGDATVQLKIHKHLGAPTGQPNNGTVQTVDRPALQGVVFDVWRVDGIDLTTNAGWDAAAAAEGVTPVFDAAGNGTVVIDGKTYNLVKEPSVTTDETGTATFTKDDGVGLYFVKENLTASTTITDLSTGDQVAAASITPSAPFFVTLPMTNPDDLDSWMYDVRVYPKNQSDTITKTVDDEETYTVGKEISYGFVSTISAVEDLKYYYIGDNNAYVDFTSVTVALSNGTALTGYTVGDFGGPYDYYYVLDGDAAAAGSQLSIAFTQQGLDKLEAAKKADASVTVKTTINGEVSSVPEDGKVPNQGSFIPNGDWWSNNGGDPLTPPTDTPDPEDPKDPELPETPGIPSNPVYSYFGNIKVNKSLVNAAAGDTTKGATFAVYVDPTPTTDCTAEDVTTGTKLMEKAITEGDEVVFEPLRASNWANNAALTAASDTNGWIQYCVVETKAPDGYNLNAEPFTATIDWETGTSTLTRTAEVNISNEKSNLGNELPLTGGEGVAALSLGGLALIGAGAGYYAFTSRKRREA